ncbi:MAG: hypothetical protein ACI87E_001285 [Mariniblastus sp.]|jgi:hypothetical protein
MPSQLRTQIKILVIENDFAMLPLNEKGRSFFLGASAQLFATYKVQTKNIRFSSSIGWNGSAASASPLAGASV